MRAVLQVVRRAVERAEGVLPLASAVLALLLPAIAIDRSLWLDEANSVLIASEGLRGIAERLRAENNFPAFYYLLAAWTRGFGTAEVTLRIPSLALHLGTALAIHALARRLYPERGAARYAAFLYVVSVQAIQLAQTVRMYSLLALLTTLSTLLLVRIMTRVTPAAQTLYVAVNAVGFLTHGWFAFAAFAQVVSVAIVGPRALLRRLVVLLAVAFLPFAILWLPAFQGQLGNGATSWMSRITPALLLQLLARYWDGAKGGVAILAACLVAGAWRFQALRGLLARREARLPLALAATTLIVAAAVSFVKPIYSADRYTIVALPAVCVFLGAYLALVMNPSLRLVLACWLLFVAGSAQARRAAQASAESDRATTARLLEAARPNDVLVFTSLSRAAVDYYLRRSAAEARFHEISFPADVVEHLGWREVRVERLDPLALDREAEATARRIATLLEDEAATAWVFWGRDPMVANVLRRRLDEQLGLCGSLDLKGSFFESVLQYRKLCATRGGP